MEKVNQASTPDVGTGGTVSKELNMKKKILHRFIRKVWNEGDFSAIPDYIADSYTVIHDPGSLGWLGDRGNIRDSIIW